MQNQHQEPLVVQAPPIPLLSPFPVIFARPRFVQMSPSTQLLPSRGGRRGGSSSSYQSMEEGVAQRLPTASDETSMTQPQDCSSFPPIGDVGDGSISDGARARPTSLPANLPSPISNAEDPPRHPSIPHLTPAWSITYHSWLSFSFLLGACLLWMVPQQRRTTLRCSPCIVLYAEVLLLAQFVYSIDLTETELPSDIEGINLDQLGLIKQIQHSWRPLVIKALFTAIFWLTHRQFIRETKQPFDVNRMRALHRVVDTHGEEDGAVIAGDLRRRISVVSIGGQRFKEWIKPILTKYWIWMVAIMLCVIGIGGQKVALYRITYTFLFLCFILTFQMAFRFWRRFMYAFWLIVIIYSMLVLVAIYTYQFDNFPDYWTNISHIPPQLQADIGLIKYDVGFLFLNLLTPTFFVIITIIQLHYFHDDFLRVTNISQPATSVVPSPPESRSHSKPEASEKDNVVAEDLEKNETTDPIGFGDIKEWIRNELPEHKKRFYHYFCRTKEAVMRILEIHITRLMLLATILLVANDICATHVVLMMLAVLAAPCKQQIQVWFSHAIAVFSSLLLLGRMIYQINYIDDSVWISDCNNSDPGSSSHVIVHLILQETQPDNSTLVGPPVLSPKPGNNAHWLGFSKADNLPYYIKGYIGLHVVLALQSIISLRQRCYWMTSGFPLPKCGVVFPHITRKDADESLAKFLLYMVNFGFYKFGIEMTLVMFVIVIGTHLDVMAFWYAVMLIPMTVMRRRTLAKFWIFPSVVVSVFIPLQYISAVGFPPFLCAADFILLLMLRAQAAVFKIEFKDSRNYEGGSNEELQDKDARELTYIAERIRDYVTYTENILDMLKVALFFSFYWITLALVFLAGTYRVSLLAMGYVIGTFLFLWYGNGFYLKPMNTIVRMWNYLVLYNAVVIFLKAILQVVSCVYIETLLENCCWLIQLLGTICLREREPVSSRASPFPCQIPSHDASLHWDGVVLAFLLLQRRVFTSGYFIHVIRELKAQAQLASRGSDIIMELKQRDKQRNEEEEERNLQKVMSKMKRIKASQTRKDRKTTTHYEELENSSRINHHTSPSHSPIYRPRSPPTFSLDSYREQGVSALEGLPEPRAPEPFRGRVFRPRRWKSKTEAEGTVGSRRISLAPPPLPYAPSRSGSWFRYSHSVLSPGASSHHASIRSGDYFMFDESEDENFTYIDKTDKDERELKKFDENTVPGLNISQFLSSVMKTDMEQALTEAKEAKAVPVTSTRRTSRGKLHRSVSQPVRATFSRTQPLFSSSSTSAPSTPEHQPLVKKGPEVAPLGHLTEEVDECDGRGTPDEAPELPKEDDGPPEPLLRKAIRLIRFVIQLIESALVSSAQFLNRVSFSYRFVRRTLQNEKFLLKEGRGTPAPASETVRQLEEPYSAGLVMEKKKSVAMSIKRKGTTTSLPAKDKSTPALEDALVSSGGSDDTHFSYTLLSRSELLCYLLMCLNQLMSFSLLSLPLPFMVFFWGALSVPRPSKRFWVSAIAYTEIVILIKYAFQFGFYPWAEIQKMNEPFWAPRIIGIEKKDGYAVYDLMLLLGLFFHRFMLKSMGLWKEQGGDYELDYGSSGSKESSQEQGQNSPPPGTPLAIMAPPPEHLPTALISMAARERAAHPSQDEATLTQEPTTSSTHPTPSTTIEVDGEPPPELPTSQEASVSIQANRDVVDDDQDQEESSSLLPSGPISGLIISPIPMVAQIPYRYMAPRPTEQAERHSTALSSIPKSNGRVRSAASWRKTAGKKISKASNRVWHKAKDTTDPVRAFLRSILYPPYRVTQDVYAAIFMCDFINFLVLVFGFSAFGAGGSEGVSSYLEENRVPVPFLIMLVLQFALIIVDRALYLKKSIVGKLVFQIIQVFGVHIWMFFILPAVTGREFGAAAAPQIWYFVKCVYFLLSAYQIRAGYPTRILGNVLTKGYNYVNMVLFKIFMLVPFLFELRAVMDWMFTKTSLGLFEWVKMEDIFASIFYIKCWRRAEQEYPLPRGEDRPAYIKYGLGGAVLFAIVAIIWFPLVLFALGNTVGLASPPHDVNLQLQIGAYQPLFSVSAQRIADFDRMSRTYQYFRDAVSFLSNYQHEDVVLVQLKGNSTATWSISPPSQEEMVDELRTGATDLSITLSYRVTRSAEGVVLSGVLEGQEKYTLEPNDPLRLRLADVIDPALSVNQTLSIPHMLPKFLRISSSRVSYAPQLVKSADQIMKQDKEAGLRSLTLDLVSSNKSIQWWEVKENCSDHLFMDLPYADSDCDFLKIYTFSDKSFPSSIVFEWLSGGGIIGVYISVVLFLAKFFRTFFSGTASQIMFEDLPNVDRLLQLCLDIYLVRECHELCLEEDLYAKLIFLYRSPETLIKWTREPIDENRPASPQDGD
ncbi:unnamed protein product [Cyprideis torosa]|uniref:Uncharacterized protein n=1 Tax=Cyprideis torosa TaxID=163714 RepID=A0A7R8ZJ61_9CRUS|nr:unnamed protein product [Cyprideis torosa]CAG0881547.1 unnamed protein product [Cyprideis torosa]